MLELHTWSPAFNLPSLSAPCLAATAYLLQAQLPLDTWTLCPSSDPSVSPFGELPALRDTETDVWVAAGFAAIVDYLRRRQIADLDAQLDQRQWADGVAYTALLQSRGAPLLDLSLYVASENWHGAMRAVLGSALKWPRAWTVSGQMRERARVATEHLGLGSLDVDALEKERERREKERGLSGQIPDRLRGVTKKTLSGVLGGKGKGNQFRLTAVMDDFFEPLDELLRETEKGGKDEAGLLGTNTPTTLDCLTVAYLAVMLRADLPQSFLRTALVDKYPKLARWADIRTKDWFGTSMTVACNLDIDSLQRDWPALPWNARTKRSWLGVGRDIVESLTESLPVVGPLYLHPHVEIRTGGPEEDQYKDRQVALIAVKRRQLLYGRLIGGCLGLGVTFGWLLWAGMLRLPTRRPREQTRGGEILERLGQCLALAEETRRRDRQRFLSAPTVQRTGLSQLIIVFVLHESR